MLKQLKGFMVIGINGGDLVTYTFDEIDPETGEPVSTNNKKSFYVTDPVLLEHVNAIRQYIRENKLS